MQTVISVIEELAAEAGKPRWDWKAEEENAELKAALTGLVGADLDAAYQVVTCSCRKKATQETVTSSLSKTVSAHFASLFPSPPRTRPSNFLLLELPGEKQEGKFLSITDIHPDSS